MSRIAFIFIAAVLLLSCCTSVEGGFVEFEVQLANGDDSFFSFGTIYGDVQENVSVHGPCPCRCLDFCTNFRNAPGTCSLNLCVQSQLFSKLTWDRPEYNPAQQEAFAALVKQNG